ncbi:MAG: methionyl-tRNA formyltransferase [bacterium]
MRLVFLGNGAFGVPSLRALAASSHTVAAVVTRPDRPAGRGREPTPSPPARAAEELGLPVVGIDNLKDPGTEDELRGLEADLWVVAAFPIIPRELLSIPPKGIINLHASLLPAYRGAAPIQRAIMAGEERTGVSTFFIDADVDTGAICLQEEVEIGPTETAGELHDRLAALGADLVVETVDRVEQGTAPRIPQEDSEATPAPKVSKEEGALDWEEDAAGLAARIRGLNPWPGTWTFHDGERIIIRRARMAGGDERPWSEDRAPPPGSIELLEDGTPVAAAGDGGGVVLLEIQRAGRKSVPGADAARGLRWKGGERLDRGGAGA